MDLKLIREATLEDASDLSVLMGELGYPTNEDEMGARLAKIIMNPDYQTFVYEDEERLIGMIGMIHSYRFEKNDSYIRVIAVVVSEHDRGKGIGKSLFMHAMRWGHRRGAKEIVLNSGNRPERAATHEIYRNWGFNGTSTGFYKRIEPHDLGVGQVK